MNDQHIYLVRHGETALNADGRLRGLADPDLNETGVQQAGALGRAFAHIVSPVGVSSPLRRAVQTAALIAEHTGAAHVVDERFNDRDYGPWTGKVKSDVLAQWGTIDAAPGVEPTSAVIARVWPALEAWVDQTRAGDRTLIVVTHDAVIRPILTRIAAEDLPASVPNGSYQVLKRTEREWHIVTTDQIPQSTGLL